MTSDIRSAIRSGSRVLVVDDAAGVRSYLANLLSLHGYEVDTAEDGRSALALLEGGADPDVILLDVMMPGLGGIETLRRIRQIDDSVPVIMLSVVGKATTIVEAMQIGANDYINKPFEDEEVEVALHQVLEMRALAGERDLLASQLIPSGDSVVWASEQMRNVKGILEQIADTDVTILIQGESGCGKEIVARTAHDLSTRRDEAFVKVNCAALPEDLLESELFGYEKGAFTGASARKYGKFELANKGTIFLDEIGEMSPGLQAKLLQVLQDSEFSRLGGNKEVKVDVRVITATNRRLVEMVGTGGFREDLYFRLNVVNVELPPLRERREELQPLISSFLRRFSARYGKHILSISDRLMEAFEHYPFPGNVRELENMIKRIVVLESEESILSEVVGRERAMRASGETLRTLIDEVVSTAGEIPLREVAAKVALEAERETIDRVLDHTHWNRKQAARLLGVSYKTLLQKIRVCGLEPS